MTQGLLLVLSQSWISSGSHILHIRSCEKCAVNERKRGINVSSPYKRLPYPNLKPNLSAFVFKYDIGTINHQAAVLRAYGTQFSNIVASTLWPDDHIHWINMNQSGGCFSASYLDTHPPKSILTELLIRTCPLAFIAIRTSSCSFRLWDYSTAPFHERRSPHESLLCYESNHRRIIDCPLV